MAYPKSDRIQFPSRSARLNVTHPMCARGIGRGVICVANPDGSATELQSGLNYNWATLANQAGEMTPWGPACFAKTTTSGGVAIPNNMNLGVADVFTNAAIFQARTLNGTNAVMALTSSNGGGISIASGTGKIGYIISGVTVQVAWPNAVPGHVYAAVCSTRVSGVSPRDWGWCVDLTTGQAWYAFDNAGAISFTWTANCSFVTYASGACGDTRVFAGACMPVALTQEQQFDWLVNDPWGLWYADEVPFIQGLAASKRTTVTNALATQSALEQFLTTSPPAQVTQVALEQWALAAPPPIELAGNLGGPSHYGRFSYGLKHYSRIDAFAPVFSADLTIAPTADFSGGLAPIIVLAADLDVHVNLVDFSGGLAPQIALGGSLSLDLPLTALDGSFGFSVVYGAPEMISGPLWADTDPCPSLPWAPSDPCPPPPWMTSAPCGPVVWSKSRMCNG